MKAYRYWAAARRDADILINILGCLSATTDYKHKTVKFQDLADNRSLVKTEQKTISDFTEDSVSLDTSEKEILWTKSKTSDSLLIEQIR